MLDLLLVVFQKSEQIPIAVNNVVHTLSYLGMEYTIEFEVYLKTEPSGWTQIIEFEPRQPSLYYGQSGDKFEIGSSISGKSYKYKHITHKMTAKKWYNIEISQLINDDGKVRYALIAVMLIGIIVSV